MGYFWGHVVNTHSYLLNIRAVLGCWSPAGNERKRWRTAGGQRRGDQLKRSVQRSGGQRSGSGVPAPRGRREQCRTCARPAGR